MPKDKKTKRKQRDRGRGNGGVNYAKSEEKKHCKKGEKKYLYSKEAIQ